MTSLLSAQAPPPIRSGSAVEGFHGAFLSKLWSLAPSPFSLEIEMEDTCLHPGELGWMLSEILQGGSFVELHSLGSGIRFELLDLFSSDCFARVLSYLNWLWKLKQNSVYGSLSLPFVSARIFGLHVFVSVILGFVPKG